MLKGHAVTLTFKKQPKCSGDTSQYDDHLRKKNDKIRLQITKLQAGHDFAVRSCCDLDLQGSSLNLHSTRHHNMVIIHVKQFLNQLQITSYGPEIILVKGHAVTLTFKVAAQMLRVTRRVNMVIISVKYFQNLTSNNEVIGRTRFCCKVML